MPSSLFGANLSTRGQQTAQPTDMNQIKSLLQSSSNPMATVQMLASQGNPNAKTVLSYLQNGSTPKQAVLNILQQRGIPVQAFLQNPLFKN